MSKDNPTNDNSKTPITDAIFQQIFEEILLEKYFPLKDPGIICSFFMDLIVSAETFLKKVKLVKGENRSFIMITEDSEGAAFVSRGLDDSEIIKLFATFLEQIDSHKENSNDSDSVH